eukprot:2181125-Rhodomonas_salina.1
MQEQKPSVCSGAEMVRRKSSETDITWFEELTASLSGPATSCDVKGPFKEDPGLLSGSNAMPQSLENALRLSCRAVSLLQRS